MIRGAYNPDEIPSIFESLDVISNAYGYNDSVLDYALSDKLLFHDLQKASLGFRWHVHSKKAIGVKIGFEIDFDSPNCKEELISFLDNIDYYYCDLGRRCGVEMRRVNKDNDACAALIRAFPKLMVSLDNWIAW